MAEKEKITGTKEYHKNPRHITDERKKELEQNMIELGDISGITHDLNTDEIISGNQRSKIIKLNECEIIITEKYANPTAQGTVKIGHVIWQGQKFNYRAVRWDENQRAKANITANALTGFWSHEILGNDWGDFDLEKWGLPADELKALEVKEDKKKEAHRKLTEIFLVPPFSILDSRQGYWMERKKAWKVLIQDNGESREGTLAKDNIMETVNNGVSLLDPVLAELVSYWFGVLNKIEQDFEPQGFTALWLLAESHFAVHTFPEKGKSYIELSSCNEEKQKTFLTILDFEIYQYQENISLGEN